MPTPKHRNRRETEPYPIGRQKKDSFILSEPAKRMSRDAEFVSQLQEYIDLTDREAEKIRQIANELGGYAPLAKGYDEMLEINRILHKLNNLITGHYTYPPKMMPEEEVAPPYTPTNTQEFGA